MVLGGWRKWYGIGYVLGRNRDALYEGCWVEETVEHVLNVRCLTMKGKG